MDTHTRVVIFISSLTGGGAEKMMLHICRGLLDRGYEVDLILARAGGEYLNDVPDDARLVTLDASRELFSLYGLVQYLRRVQPDYMLSTGTGINLLAVWAPTLARAETEVVIRVQTTLSRSFQRRARTIHRFLPWLVRNTYSAADHIVANSAGVADDLVATLRLNRDDVQIIHNPTVTEELFKRARESVDLPWNDNFDGPMLVTAGRLVPEKDFSTLIRAINSIGNEPDVRLLILGQGSQRTELERLSEHLNLADRVWFLGFVDNPYPYLRLADLFVLSSMWEGLPNALIEALACGTKVVATDCPSGPSEILRGGEFGTLVPVGDPDALATGIVTELATERSRDALRKRATDFSLEAVLPDYEALLS